MSPASKVKFALNNTAGVSMGYPGILPWTVNTLIWDTSVSPDPVLMVISLQLNYLPIRFLFFCLFIFYLFSLLFLYLLLFLLFSSYFSFFHLYLIFFHPTPFFLLSLFLFLQTSFLSHYIFLRSLLMIEKTSKIIKNNAR